MGTVEPCNLKSLSWSWCCCESWVKHKEVILKCSQQTSLNSFYSYCFFFLTLQRLQNNFPSWGCSCIAVQTTAGAAVQVTCSKYSGATTIVQCAVQVQCKQEQECNCSGATTITLVITLGGNNCTQRNALLCSAITTSKNKKTYWWQIIPGLIYSMRRTFSI